VEFVLGMLNSEHYLLLTLLGSYLIVLLGLTVGWNRVLSKAFENTPESIQHTVSVIVPVRNESVTIAAVLHDLMLQNYSPYEVIVVDDHSSDSTAEKVKEFIAGNHPIRLITNTGHGKKQALTTGIQVAGGSIIVTTDADCRMNPEWLSIVNNHFQSKKITMTIGGVKIDQDSNLFSHLQALEFCSLVGSGAATLAVGFPTMCNGANLAFRKSVFQEVHGYEGNMHIPSGDDEFLMRKIAKQYPDSISFMADQGAVVRTRALVDVSTFLQQRIRWAGKWRFNSSVFTKVLALYVMVVQFFWMVLMVMVITDPIKWILFVGMKLALEGIFIFSVCRFLKVRWHWLGFFILQLVYPVYVVGVGVFSLFLPFTWKDRKTQSVT